MNGRTDKAVAIVCAALIAYPVIAGLMNGGEPIRALLGALFLVIPFGVFQSRSWGFFGLAVLGALSLCSFPALFMFPTHEARPTAYLVLAVARSLVDAAAGVYGLLRLRQGAESGERLVFKPVHVRVAILALIAIFLLFASLTGPRLRKNAPDREEAVPTRRTA
jgi:hypothetical protein